MKQDCGSRLVVREERLVALLQSWKRVHRKMQRRHDPFTQMVAADIAKLADQITHHQGRRLRESDVPHPAANRIGRRLN
jgi:hypothetical protein